MAPPATPRTPHPPGSGRPPAARGVLGGAMAVTAVASAKINLALRVGARRRDGYHALATLFQAVTLEDEVRLLAGGSGVRIEVSGPEAAEVPTGADNLVARALELLAAHTGHGLAAAGVQVRLVKRIPAAAGLAGGSADAAATLVAADALWRTRLPRAELLGLAATLGADVPFSLTGGTAVGTGRGDVLAPALARGEFHWVLAFADGRLSTPAVFAECDRLRGPAGPGGPPVPRVRELIEGPPAQGWAGAPGPGGRPRPVAGPRPVSPTSPPARPVRVVRVVQTLPPPVAPVLPAVVLAAVRSGDAGELGRTLLNDLQPAALSLLPRLARCLDAGLELGALGAVLCGSGPTWAFLAPDRAGAVALAASLAGTGLARSVVAVTAPAAGARLVTRSS